MARYFGDTPLTPRSDSPPHFDVHVYVCTSFGGSGLITSYPSGRQEKQSNIIVAFLGPANLIPIPACSPWAIKHLWSLVMHYKI